MSIIYLFPKSYLSISLSISLSLFNLYKMPFIVTYCNLENNKTIQLAYNDNNYPVCIFDNETRQYKQIFILDLQVGNIMKDKYTNNKYETMNIEYVDRYIACVAGECTIISPKTNTPMRIDELQIGDEVYTINKKITKIIAILRTKLSSTYTFLLKNENGLKITNYHPVQNKKGEWCFPCECLDEYTICLQPSSYVYSIALEEGHILYINDTPVIGLAHNMQDNIIVKHPYFGTRRILQSIYTINPKGYATITDTQIYKNKNTGLADGIIV